jgi:hypothetical protein
MKFLLGLSPASLLFASTAHVYAFDVDEARARCTVASWIEKDNQPEIELTVPTARKAPRGIS